MYGRDTGGCLAYIYIYPYLTYGSDVATLHRKNEKKRVTWPHSSAKKKKNGVTWLQALVVRRRWTFGGSAGGDVL
uniref:Uncharacterized protein n=1 Tax=Arundo donax TaxID=35708 RepID=A0A0A9CI88_ARUDO